MGQSNSAQLVELEPKLDVESRDLGDSSEDEDPMQIGCPTNYISISFRTFSWKTRGAILAINFEIQWLKFGKSKLHRQRTSEDPNPRKSPRLLLH